MIELRPAKYLLGRLAPMDNNDKIPQFNLGAGTYNSTVYLRGDGVWANPLAGAGFVPLTRELTINGVTYDLSANRTWTIDKASVGLGNVDNTSDLNKPISTATQTALNAKENTANKGIPGGYASLAGDGKVPSDQLPSYVDDVIEVANYAALPTVGQTGIIYITLDNNNVYRWAGSVYVQISQPNAVWGSITGTLSSQTDLQNALNAKQDDITLTTTGTSGAATFIGNTLNIPQYDGGLIGYVPYTGATANVNLGEYGLSAGWVQIDTTPTTYTPGVGKIGWNDQDGTLEFQLKGGNVTLQIGQEQVSRVVNKTDPLIDLLEANYPVVKVTGAQGNRLKVALAQANNDANSAETLGIVTENIPGNQEGFITTSGLVRNINTTGSLQGETWADGDMLYLSGTVAGKITKVKPSAPIHTVILGYVVRAHATQGQIYVKVDNGYELGELHDVNTNLSKATPVDADSVLLQDTADSNIWKKLSWLNTKATLKTYFDTLYQVVGSYVPTSRTLTVNGTTYDLSANRSWNVGTVTSVGLSAPTGFSVSNSPVITNGTLGLSFASGYSLPTNLIQSTWTEAYNDKINSASVTGTTTKTLTLNQQDGGTITASWTDDNTDAVSSVFGRTGAVVAVSGDYNTSQVTENTNLYYTEARVNANANVAANTAARHNAVTLGTANGLSLSTQQLSLGLASGSTTGALSSSNWNTFNNKQNAITLTTTGSSGSATLIGSTLNIPNYSSALSGYVPTSRQLTINGTSYDLSADRSWDVGTVTSIGITAGPRIVSEDGPITSSGNITISHGIGQGLDIQGAQDLMNRSIEDGGSFEAFRCLATSLGELGDFETPLGTFNSIGTVVQNIMLDEFGHILGIGSKTLYTSDIIEDTNLYFTDARARAAISLTTTGTGGAATYNNSTGVLNIPQYQSVITNPITGTGTTNYVSKFTGSGSIGDSIIFDNGTNVGIGTSGPGEKLDVAGNIKLSNSDSRVKAGDTIGRGIYSNSNVTSYITTWGSAHPTSAYNIEIIAGSGTSSGNIILNTATNERMRITSDGKVGIGTTSPSRKLYVSGQIGLNDDLISENGSNILRLGYQSYYGSGGFNLVTENSIPLTFGTSSVERMRIASGGNVGIGTTNPGEKLTVVGNVSLSGDYNIGIDITTNGNSKIGRLDRAYLQVNRSNFEGFLSFHTTSSGAGSLAERMRITSDGKVGIGTTTPQSKLSVDGDIRLQSSTASPKSLIFSSPASNWGPQDSSLKFIPSDGVNAATSFTVNLWDGIGSISERMRITSDGKVGIGTDIPSSKLTVQGTGRVLSALSTNDEVVASFSHSSNSISTIGFYGSGSANDYSVRLGVNLDAFVAYTANTEKMRITSDGKVGIGTDIPSEKLEVNGNVQIGTSVDAKLYMVSSGGNGYNERFFIEGYADGGTYGGGFKLSTRNDSNVFNTAVTVNRNGYVGIGITTPDNGKLTILKNSSYATENSYGISIQSNTSNAYTELLIGADDTVDCGVIQTAGKNTSFTTKKLSLQPNGGKVGIGTTSPSAKLHVSGVDQLLDDGTNGRLTLEINSGQNDIYSTTTAFGAWKDLRYTANDHYFRNGGTEVMRLTGGKVGIGTTNPGSRLTVQTSTSSSSDSLRITDGTGVINIGHWDTLTNRFEFSGKPTYFVQYGSGNYMSFGTNGSEKMRITDTGNVGIGTTSPDPFKLAVNGTVGVMGTLNSTLGSYYIDHPGVQSWKIGVSNTNTSTLSIGNDLNGAFANKILNLTNAGNVGIGTTTPATSLELRRLEYVALTLNDTYATTQILNTGGRFVINTPSQMRFDILSTPRVYVDAVSMGVNTATPFPSAALQVDSQTQGFLPPRMSDSEMNAIAGPEPGLIVWNTDTQTLFVYDGSNWRKIAYA